MSGRDLERLKNHDARRVDQIENARKRRVAARWRARKRRRDRKACEHDWKVEDLPVTGNKLPGSRVKLTCRKCGLVHHTIRASLWSYVDA